MSVPPDRVRTLFPTSPGEFVLRDPAGNEVMRVPWMQPSVSQEPPPEPPGMVESALKRGALNTASDFTNTAGLIAETFGSDEYAQGFYEKADEFSTRSQQYTPTVGRVENIKSAEDLGAFLVETLVEQAPMLASMLVPGGVVAKSAQLAGAGARAASVAGTTAAFLSNVGLQTGESTTIAREAKASPVDVRVVGSGLGKAALDFAPLIGIARRIGLLKNLPISTTIERTLVGKLAEGGFIRRALGHSGAIVAREVPTEVAQEALNIALQRALQEYSGELTEEERSQLVNAAAGATAFGLLGIPAAVRRPAPDQKGLSEGGTPEGVDIQVDETEQLPLDLGPGEGPPGTGTGQDSALVGEIEVVPDPEVGEEGFVSDLFLGEVKLPKLDDIAEDPVQKQAAIEALSNEAALTDSAFYIDLNGDMISSIPSDPMSRSEGGIDPISVGLELTREQLEVASSYPQYLLSDPSTPENQVLAALHPQLQTLYELRNDLTEDADNYRTTDGQLKKAAQTKINNVDKRIARLQENLGITPVDTESKVATPENVQQGEIIVETPPTKLTDRQKLRLAELSEKESTEGLSTPEMDTYSELIGIASGEFGPVERQKQTQAQLTETAELATQVRESETLRVGERLATRTGTKGIPGTGVIASDAKVVLTPFSQAFRYGPQVRLLSRNNPEVQARMRRYGKDIRGWFDPKKPGTINIIPTNHFTEKDLLATYFHETLAHYGMNTFLTINEQTDLLMDILRNPPPGFNVEGFRVEIERANESIETTKQRVSLLIEAEEYIAKVAEQAILDPNNPIVQMSWWKRLIARIRRFLRKNTKFKWSDNDIMYMLRDTSKMLTGRVTPSNLAVGGNIFRQDNEMMRLFDDDVSIAGSNAIDSLGTVWGSRWAKMLFTPLQFASKYKVPGSQEFLEFTQQWWARKRILTDGPAQLVQEFQLLGRRDQQKLSQAVLEMSIESDIQQRKLTPEEQGKVFKSAGIENDTHLIKVWNEMDKSFQDVIQSLRTGLETIAIRTQGNREGSSLSREQSQSLQRQYAKAKAGTAADRSAMWKTLGVPTMLRLDEIDTEMNQLENRNYFPRMRFGNWAITIRAKKDLNLDGKSFRGPTKGKRGDVVYFETYEDTFSQKQAFDQLTKQFAETSYQMQLGKISESEFHFMGVMSPQLYEDLRMKIPEMSEVQKEVLRELYFKQAPGRSFLRHLTKRKGIDGYSEDVLRVYSSYMMNVANHIARVEYHMDMNEQINVIGDNAAQVTPDARVAGIVREFYEDQYNYLMNPKNDLAHLRAVGFLWYLGANVKSAVVNLTQVPMVAYPYLASKYGDARSSGAILNAMQLVTRKIRNGEVMPPELRKQLERAVREGFVDESRATELAGLAEQSTLQRLIPENKTGRAISNASYYGAFLFQKAERWNREVTFIAAYNLAKQNGVTSQEEAFKAGRDAVQTAMFEYAKWNRPAFMRGKKSVFFLFWQYMQGLAFMAFGGAGQGAAMRLWMMLLLAGGLQGLPFAENILDLLDFVGTKTKERLGMKDPRVDLRNDLRELARQITDRPDMIMHGLSRYYGLGPLHLLNMFEIPVPNVDISGSISAGRVLPGTQDITSVERDPSAKLGRTVADIAGPVAGIPYQIWRAALDTNPDTWKVWERTLPSAFKNMSKAVRRGVRGEETFRGGGTLAQFDAHDPEQRAENIAQFLGFATTRINQRYESDFSIENMKRYWALRRALVMENVAYARMAGDPEAIKDSIDALTKFNDSTPDGALRINARQLLRSLGQRFRRSSLRERGIPSELLYRRIVFAMRELYPETEAEIESLSQR